MATQYQIIFNCTPAQLETALVTTLPAVGYSVMRIPVKTTGIIVGTSSGTGAAAGTGQIDFSYDGQYFLTFFGGNMTASMITELTTALAGTLGAPVPPNLAVPPSFVP